MRQIGRTYRQLERLGEQASGHRAVFVVGHQRMVEYVLRMAPKIWPTSKIHGQRQTIELDDGTLIQIVTTSTPSRLRGIRAFWDVDHAASASEELWNTLHAMGEPAHET